MESRGVEPLIHHPPRKSFGLAVVEGAAQGSAALIAGGQTAIAGGPDGPSIEGARIDMEDGGDAEEPPPAWAPPRATARGAETLGMNVAEACALGALIGLATCILFGIGPWGCR